MLTFLQNSWAAMLLAAVIGYLLGSISFAILITRLFSGKDIRDFGSGNAGATNVLRSQGKLPAALTFVGDLAKSMLAVYLGGLFLNAIQLVPNPDMTLLSYNPENLAIIGSYLAGLCCVLGHIYPVFFGFRGGKGVMTILGMTLILDWRTALLALAVFTIVVLIWRIARIDCCGHFASYHHVYYAYLRLSSRMADGSILCRGNGGDYHHCYHQTPRKHQTYHRRNRKQTR